MVLFDVFAKVGVGIRVEAFGGHFSSAFIECNGTMSMHGTASFNGATRAQMAKA